MIVVLGACIGTAQAAEPDLDSGDNPSPAATVEEAAIQDDPQSMMLKNVPAGSAIIFGLKEEETKSRIEVSWEQGEIESSVGLRIVESVSLDVANAGTYEFIVSHRLLGDIQGEFTVSGGVTGEQAIDWSQAPNHARLREAWSAHQDATARYEEAGVYRKRARMGQAGAALGGAIATFGLVRYLGQNGAFGTLSSEVDDLIGAGDPEGLMIEKAEERDAARASSLVGLTFLGGGTGVTLAGLGFSQFNRMKGRKGGPAVEAWNPEALEMPAKPAVDETPVEEAPAEEAPAEETPAEEAPAEEAPAEETPAEEAKIDPAPAKE
ncbi:MAG: hypothetical protein VX519_08000 [Myxococcota bacterium]|nr:hypothetical protein [Myxococcota bacterium]